MEIKTERLIIRSFMADDWRDLQNIWAELSALPAAQYDKPNPRDGESVRARLGRWIACSGPAHRFFAVCLGERLIGYIAMNQRSAGVYECGYSFHPAFHGCGYARESLRAVIGFMKSAGATKLTAGTALHNAPSVRLLKALGFTQTAVEQVSFYKDEAGNDIVFDGGVFEKELS